MYPYFLVFGQCKLTCPIAYIESPFKHECVLCLVMIPNCLNCYNQTTCETCVAGKYLANGKCTSQCPNGYFLNLASSVCQPCDSKCFTCTSSTNCVTCRQGYFLLASTLNNITTFSCTEACPIGFYASINSTCMPCSS